MLLSVSSEVKELIEGSAIILAGGKSQRMGGEKPLVELAGEPLLARSVRLLKPLFREIIVVTNKDLGLILPEVKYTRDKIPYLGPLGGMQAGLAASSNELNFVIACDMPFLKPAVIESLVKWTDEFDVVVPETENGLEPLFAFYQKRCLKYINEALEQGEKRIVSFFPKVLVKVVKLAELRKIEDVKKTFFNVNTKAELEKARKMQKQELTQAVNTNVRMPKERATTIFLNETEIVTVQSSLNNLAELAIGFLVAEGLIVKREELSGVKVDSQKGIVWVSAKGNKELRKKLLGKRYLTSGCGKGFSFSSIGDARGIGKVNTDFSVKRETLARLMKEFLQDSRVPGLHASALADNKSILLIRRDIGRHNTLDMLLGYLFLNNQMNGQLMVLTTGRISYEMVVKVAKARIPLVASRTAATDLAVDLAKELGIEVVGYVRGPRMLVYTDGERLQ
jgi:FdhD protein